ncbi:MAG: D-alanyl-D-alanine carboxypeptidase [Clostridia bacterium]|nr:D-alanyl-D-alanine carboxypeptidase [Clostridia bacterium]
MKKAFIILISLILVIRAVPVIAQAAPVDMSRAGSALLINVESGRVILEKDAEKQVESAGLVRLPALLTVCKAFDEGLIDEGRTVTVSAEAAKIKGVTAFLSPNERISSGELIKAAVILNPGDAIFALLQAIFPDEQTALDAINSELSKLGVGLLDDSPMGSGRQFSAKELAAISIELITSSSFLKYSSVYLDVLRHENASPTELANPNRLVRHYSGCFGVATGSVGSSDYAGVFAARRGTTTFLAVVMGMPDSASRFKLASDLLDYGFSSYRSVSLGETGDTVGTIPVTGGVSREVEAVTGGSVTALVPVSSAKLMTEAVLPLSVEAPIEKGDIIGTLLIKDRDGEILSEVPIIAANSVEKAGFRDSMIKMLLSWLRIPQ